MQATPRAIRTTPGESSTSDTGLSALGRRRILRCWIHNRGPRDNIFGCGRHEWLRGVAARPRHLVVLRPSIDVIAQREVERLAPPRRAKLPTDPGEFTIRPLTDAVCADRANWPVARHFAADADDTVAEIIARSAEANVYQHL